jgi:hypothetical protein
LSKALVSTNVDYLDIVEGSGQLPSQPLAGAVLARLGIPLQQQQQQQQQHHQWQQQQASYRIFSLLTPAERAILTCSVADPGFGTFLPPVSGMEQWSDPDPGSGISKQNLLIAFIQK